MGAARKHKAADAATPLGPLSRLIDHNPLSTFHSTGPASETLTALVAAEAEATGEAPPRLAALQRLAALAAGGGRAE